MLPGSCTDVEVVAESWAKHHQPYKMRALIIGQGFGGEVYDSILFMKGRVLTYVKFFSLQGFGKQVAPRPCSRRLGHPDHCPQVRAVNRRQNIPYPAEAFMSLAPETPTLNPKRTCLGFKGNIRHIGLEGYEGLEGSEVSEDQRG